VFLCLAAEGCASLPGDWKRVDKRQIDPKQLSTDRAICEDEINVNLAAGNQANIWGPTEDAKTIFTGCMVRQGYTASNPPDS